MCHVHMQKDKRAREMAQGLRDYQRTNLVTGEAGEMSHQKSEDPSSDPQHPNQSQAWQLTSELGGEGLMQTHPWGLLASLSNKSVSSRFN